jgi:hypothetical protein
VRNLEIGERAEVHHDRTQGQQRDREISGEGTDRAFGDVNVKSSVEHNIATLSMRITMNIPPTTVRSDRSNPNQ